MNPDEVLICLRTRRDRCLLELEPSFAYDPWHATTVFVSREHRQRELARFINFYHTVKPHAGIANMTPYEKLRQYFFNL